MTMNKKDFAIFILTNGRPDIQLTYDTLLKSGYTGKIYFVCDDEDITLNRYKEKYGKDVIVFNKQKEFERTDTFINTDEKRAVVFAKNYVVMKAKQMGLKNYVMADDDISAFHYKIIDGNRLKTGKIKQFDCLDDISRVGWLGYGLVNIALATATPGSDNWDKQGGGMDETYKKMGDNYCSVFSVLMAHPDCETIIKKEKNMWRNRRNHLVASPKIINEKWARK